VEHAPIKLIVGLGNPGAGHRLDRHNVGYWFVDALAQRVGGATFRAEHKFRARSAESKSRPRSATAEADDLRIAAVCPCRR
jgi:peptidyl-tRNA hydrolase